MPSSRRLIILVEVESEARIRPLSCRQITFHAKMGLENDVAFLLQVYYLSNPSIDNHETAALASTRGSQPLGT